jgi:hypothetical protein
MTALDEYYKPDHYVNWHDGRVCVDKDVSDAAIESLECCGNCGERGDHYDPMRCQQLAVRWREESPNAEEYWVAPNDYCYRFPEDRCVFSPSCWKERKDA